MPLDWYSELTWIRDYRFPLYPKKGQSAVDCLSEWINDYNSSLQSNITFLGTEEKQRIINTGNNLVEALNLYLQNNFAGAFTLFNDTMNAVKTCLPTVRVGKKRNCLAETYPYYRICAGNNHFTYKDCLHIPYKKRNLASTGRFSSPGMPCSYMASCEEIAWFECGMPNEFQLAEYLANERTEKQLLCLDINPLTDTISLINLGRNNPTEEKLRYLAKNAAEMCYVLPLIAACSVVAKDKYKQFVDAYIIPQMLMAWIKTCTDYVGVRYRSDVDNILVRNNGGYNVAMPAIEPDEDGYSTVLMNLFGISKDGQNNNLSEKCKKSEVKTIDTSKKFTEKFKTQLNELAIFCADIQYQQEHTKSGDLYEILANMHSVCYTFQVLLDDYIINIENKKYAIVVTLSKIAGWAEIVLKAAQKDLKKMNSTDGKSHKDIKQTKELIQTFEKTVVEFANEVYFDLIGGGLWAD